MLTDLIDGPGRKEIIVTEKNKKFITASLIQLLIFIYKPCREILRQYYAKIFKGKMIFNLLYSTILYFNLL